jgi:hypothetical protein
MGGPKAIGKILSEYKSKIREKQRLKIANLEETRQLCKL